MCFWLSMNLSSLIFYYDSQLLGVCECHAIWNNLFLNFEMNEWMVVYFIFFRTHSQVDSHGLMMLWFRTLQKNLRLHWIIFKIMNILSLRLQQFNFQINWIFVVSFEMRILIYSAWCLDSNGSMRLCMIFKLFYEGM